MFAFNFSYKDISLCRMIEGVVLIDYQTESNYNSTGCICKPYSRNYSSKKYSFLL